MRCSPQPDLGNTWRRHGLSTQLVRIHRPRNAHTEQGNPRLILMFADDRRPFGAQSLAGLCTVGGVRHRTWRSVASALGLLRSTARIRNALHEAVSEELALGNDLREFLALMHARLDDECDLFPNLLQFCTQLRCDDCGTFEAMLKDLHACMLRHGGSCLLFLPQYRNVLRGVSVEGGRFPVCLTDHSQPN